MPNTKISGIKAEGLCSTCNNAPGCTLSVKSTQAVWECEEYEDSAPLPAKNAFEGASANGDALFSGALASPEGKQYQGLCVNCETRETCRHGKSEAGVWHCEDYQ